MTHQARDSYPRQRAARHAAGPAAGRPPLRIRARRVLRLLAAAASLAAGLCLIVALIAIVVTVTRPASVSATVAARAEPTASAFRGHGTAALQFATAGQVWQLNWSFRCAGPSRGSQRGPAGRPAPAMRGRRGQGRRGSRQPGPVSLSIRVSPAGPRLTRRGRSGSGSTGLYRGTGTHQVMVRSRCTWVIRLMRGRG